MSEILSHQFQHILCPKDLLTFLLFFYRSILKYGPEARIAPPISKTEDCIYDTYEPESTHSHCVSEKIWLKMPNKFFAPPFLVAFNTFNLLYSFYQKYYFNFILIISIISTVQSHDGNAKYCKYSFCYV